ncbi:MAG: VOC family protein [Actinomycetaceae bacterium]|nr:VOC family protein [Actinomycetaceae bacterium]
MTKSDLSIVPCVWISEPLESAIDYYSEIFRDVTVEKSGNVAQIAIHGEQLMILAADESYTPNPSISGVLNFDPLLFGGEDGARDYLRECHAQLGEGGDLMPLGEYPFSPLYAWVRDRFGFTWQLMLTDPAGEPAPFFIPAFMFGGSNHGNCEAATNHWMSLFGGERKSLLRYDEKGPLDAGTIQFTNFTLRGRWFAAMDSGTFHDFTFSPGVSISASVSSQAELDALWAGLSRKAEAEQCGWCQDEWGVSWQIVPSHIAHLWADPDIRSRILSMGKIELEEELWA